MKRYFFVLILLSTFGLNYIFAQTWKSFTTENSELPDNSVSSITIGNNGTIWFGTSNGLASFKDDQWKGYSTDDGLSNNKINSASFLPMDSQNLWIGSNFGAAIFDVDFNNEINNPQYITKADNDIVSDTVTAIDLDDLSDNWIGTDKGLSVITNSGIYNFTEKNGLEHSKVNALKSLSNNWVHVGTSGGGVTRLKYNGVDGITSASNIITTWSYLPSDTVLTIYVTDDTLYWYGTTSGVGTFYGENSKEITHWWVYNTFSSGIIDNYVRAIIRDHDGNMWFGTRKGLSMKSALDSSWKSFTEEDGLVSNNIFDIKIDEINNLWIATDKGVSYLSDISTSVQNKNPVSYKINLINYPNPFNPETNISYSIPKNSNVKLEIFDALGQAVETLINEKQNVGDYQVLFNIKNHPSGVYFYRLTTDETSITKKMVVLK